MNILINNTPKIAFLFLFYVVISSAFINQIIPCQTQKILSNNITLKHVGGILLIFVFIMLEGGWSFDEKIQNMESSSWLDGNALDSIVWAVILYIIFLLSSKMKASTNFLLYFVLFLLYIFNTQKLFWEKRNLLSEGKKEKYNKINKLLIILCICIYVFGIGQYFIYQKQDYGTNFSFKKFILGTNKCSNI